MSKNQKILIMAVALIVLIVQISIVSYAADVIEAFHNKDANYDFADGPGGEIMPPPPEDKDLVEWEEENRDIGEDIDSFTDYTIDPQRINVLLIGVDKRPGSRRAPLSDTIIIFSFCKMNGDPVLISIPRDSYVNIPGRYKDKINHSHAFGGQALLRQTIEEFTGIPIHYYLRVNFEGFAGIVDMLGGVEIFVDRRIDHLEKGPQIFSGEDALAYCRFRNEPRGDFARMERQQRFLIAIAKRIQEEAQYKVPGLIREGAKYVDTDMPILIVLDFAEEFCRVDPNSVIRYSVSGKGFYFNGVYYLEPSVRGMHEFISQHLVAKSN